MINVEKTFKKEVIENKGITIVDFWAPWCGPCKMFGPIFENAQNKYEDIKFCKLNIDEDSSNVSEDFGVMSIPTIIAFKDGKEVKRNIGFISENDFDDFLENI